MYSKYIDRSKKKIDNDSQGRAVCPSTGETPRGGSHDASDSPLDPSSPSSPRWERQPPWTSQRVWGKEKKKTLSFSCSKSPFPKLPAACSMGKRRQVAAHGSGKMSNVSLPVPQHHCLLIQYLVWSSFLKESQSHNSCITGRLVLWEVPEVGFLEIQ